MIAPRLLTAPVVAVLTAWLFAVARRVDANDRARALGPARSRLPHGLHERLARALVAADVGLDAGAAVHVWLLGALAAGCLAVGLDLALALPAGLAVVVGGPVALHLRRHRGARRAASELPTVLEQVASELRSGGTVAGALAAFGSATSSTRPTVLSAELARVDRRCALGAPLDDALAAWARERADPGVRSAAGALAVAALTGGRSADALDGLASSVRDRLEIAAEARALSAQARLSAVVVGCLPVAYLLGCALLDPRQVRVLTHTAFGLVCLTIGLTLEGLAAVWIRFIMREEG